MLAVWSAFKLENETAKLVMVWWCLLAFIGSGYEHSVANMTLLTLANLTTDAAAITWNGMAHNLLWVTMGNVVSGATFVGAAYWFVTESHAAVTTNVEERDVPTASQAD